MLVVVFAVIGATGWYVYDKNQKDDVQPTSQSDNSQATQQESDQYFELKELGVKLTLPEGLKDLQYEPVSGVGIAGVNLSSASLSELAARKNPGSSCVDSLGFIYKYDQRPQPTEFGPKILSEKEIGNAFFVYGIAPAACMSDPEFVALNSKQLDLMKAVFQTMTLIER